MPRIRYETNRLSPETTATIARANTIIAEYEAMGFNLTLRQLYYQFVSRDWIANNDREYKKLGDAIQKGRLNGLIDWDAITDRMRTVSQLTSWDGPDSIVRACSEQFRLDLWARQPQYLMCLIEKDALVGVIEGVCNELRVPYMACRGYASVSSLWQIGNQRLRPLLRAGKEVTVLYLGDHDPSGIDMTRDVRERLNLFAASGGTVGVERLALNMDQIEAYGPPPNPTKMTDSRAEWYVDEHGHECWELDALEPTVISDLIRHAVLSRRDDDLWAAAEAEERAARRQLAWIAGNWEDVVSQMPEEDEDEGQEPDEDE
jgi:hypothetical protein